MCMTRDEHFHKLTTGGRIHIVIIVQTQGSCKIIVQIQGSCKTHIVIIVQTQGSSNKSTYSILLSIIDIRL